MLHQNEHNPSYYICKQTFAPFAVRKSFQKVTSHVKQAACFSSSEQTMNRTFWHFLLKLVFKFHPGIEQLLITIFSVKKPLIHIT